MCKFNSQIYLIVLEKPLENAKSHNLELSIMIMVINDDVIILFIFFHLFSVHFDEKLMWKCGYKQFFLYDKKSMIWNIQALEVEDDSTNLLYVS